MPRARYAATTLFIALFGLAPLGREARADSAALDAARAAYADLDYQRVLPLVDDALLDALTPAERVSAYELRAFVYAIDGHTQLSRDAFREVLKVNPRYDLPVGASPKLRAPLEEARTDAERAAVAAAQAPVAPVPIEPTLSTLPTAPLAVAHESGPPLFRRPVFWVGVGAAVLAGTVLVIVATHDGTPAHDFGPYTIHSVDRLGAPW